MAFRPLRAAPALALLATAFAGPAKAEAPVSIPLTIGHYVLQACSADHHTVRLLFAMAADVIPTDRDQYFPSREQSLALMSDLPGQFDAISSRYESTALTETAGDTGAGVRMYEAVRQLLDNRAAALSEQVHYPGVRADLLAADAENSGSCRGESLTVFKIWHGPA
jgi:hypothetical protein